MWLRLLRQVIDNFRELFKFSSVQIFVWGPVGLFTKVFLSCPLQLWEPLVDKRLVTFVVGLPPRLVLVDPVVGHSVIDKTWLLPVSVHISNMGLHMNSGLFVLGVVEVAAFLMNALLPIDRVIVVDLTG